MHGGGAGKHGVGKVCVCVVLVCYAACGWVSCGCLVLVRVLFKVGTVRSITDLQQTKSRRAKEERFAVMWVLWGVRVDAWTLVCVVLARAECGRGCAIGACAWADGYSSC